MSDPGGGFWTDAGGRWRSGMPPPTWRQDEKGRWHPTVVPEAVDPARAAAPPPPPPPTAQWQPPIARQPADEHRSADAPTDPVPLSPPPRPLDLDRRPTRVLIRSRRERG